MVDSVRTLLNELIRESGMSRSQVAKAVGRNRAYIHQFMLGRPRNLPERERQRLGELFGVDPERFRGEEAVSTRPLDPRLVARTNAAVQAMMIDDARIEAEVFAALYTLLERSRSGQPITDDETTLRIIRELITAIRRHEP